MGAEMLDEMTPAERTTTFLPPRPELASTKQKLEVQKLENKVAQEARVQKSTHTCSNKYGKEACAYATMPR